MCLGCYEEAGYPATVTDEARKAAALAARVYEFSCVGGNLHVQLDDWNLDDEFFDDPPTLHDDVGPEQMRAEQDCLAAFKALSCSDRHVALALADGYLNDDGSYAECTLLAMEPEPA